VQYPRGNVLRHPNALGTPNQLAKSIIDRATGKNRTAILRQTNRARTRLLRRWQKLRGRKNPLRCGQHFAQAHHLVPGLGQDACQQGIFLLKSPHATVTMIFGLSHI
jgi:hypothetical protein